ncbi:hypothetical protein Osc7112_1115 [Oscillatoria nigro-viridis PCC 7112]|uniref:Uncharacterized protein n=1 Tax=Phormidium nigroviride PCC 7112 TaxID=179408 RepID=K9VEJ4_9CYAN|nr:hypothetical protein Osc7112_1115 [Oscillatoria nigro-viridis PCC 7112]
MPIPLRDGRAGCPSHSGMDGRDAHSTQGWTGGTPIPLRDGRAGRPSHSGKQGLPTPTQEAGFFTESAGCNASFGEKPGFSSPVPKS